MEEESEEEELDQDTEIGIKKMGYEKRVKE
jgi:hypothetical protein